MHRASRAHCTSKGDERDVASPAWSALPSHAMLDQCQVDRCRVSASDVCYDEDDIDDEREARSSSSLLGWCLIVVAVTSWAALVYMLLVANLLPVTGVPYPDGRGAMCTYSTCYRRCSRRIFVEPTRCEQTLTQVRRRLRE
eukprot:CAMPEP_0203841202 /NCGR_PEP_ID=MMETSP0359-20131031/1240_1 /ASSEMBLY_ACC=CAM_ASM_000338 /TAXON_ID=268821 /ORGANISM="Scrippsiella Hangoei, Strain SHTV-5" /LENGTH=140 /DNA_ID=CAMNT_0050755559 /DNA_START=1 /DNA_END=423 /DNA_ORIENTATION=+